MRAYLESSLDKPPRDVLSIIQARIRSRTTYFGVRTRKDPLDYWVYQELIFESEPDAARS